MELGKRHRTRLKPAVQDLADVMHFCAVTFERNIHNLRQVIIIQFTTRNFFKFRKATNHLHHFRAIIFHALPHWNWCCPITIAAQVPIRRLLDDIVKSSSPQIVWRPACLLVRLQHFLFLALNIHKPTRMSAVHQFRTASMTMRIFVANIFNFQRPTLFQQSLRYLFIYFPNIATQPSTFCVISITVNQR